MSKPVILSTDKWSALHSRLMKDFPASVMLLSWKCKEVLRFTIRKHHSFKVDQHGKSRFVTDVRLDFYNEPKRTMLLLKYGDYLGADNLDQMD